MYNYRRFLEETPETTMTPEAMRRLADLEIEKQFGIRTGDAKPREMAAPQPAQTLAGAQSNRPNPAAAGVGGGLRESDEEFERRTTAESQILPSGDAGAAASVVGGGARPSGVTRACTASAGSPSERPTASAVKRWSPVSISTRRPAS